MLLIQIPSRLPLILKLFELTYISILERISWFEQKFWVKAPLRWNPDLGESVANRSPSNKPKKKQILTHPCSQTIPWLLIQFLHILCFIYIFVSGLLIKLANPYKSITTKIPLWYVLSTIFVIALDVVALLTIHSQVTKRLEIVEHAEKVLQITGGNHCGNMTLETLPLPIPPKLIHLVLQLISKGFIAISHVIGPIGVGLIAAFYIPLDPAFHVLRFYPHWRQFAVVQFYITFISPWLLPLHVYNLMDTISYFLVFHIIFEVKFVLSFATTIIYHSNVSHHPRREATLISSALMKYVHLCILSNHHETISESVTPAWISVANFTSVLAGAATILGREFLGISPLLYPIYPIFFVGVFCFFITILPVLVLEFQLSTIFKCTMINRLILTRNGTGITGKVIRRRIRACRNLRIKLGWMGIANRYFMLMYVNGLLNNIADVTVTVANVRSK